MHNFKKGINSLLELSVMLLSMVPGAGLKVSSTGKVNALDTQWSLQLQSCLILKKRAGFLYGYTATIKWKERKAAVICYSQCYAVHTAHSRQV
uniref:Putative secreted protein n=1 Tax=Amblyomma cajennense TaxID=34607 RepID=A0A023FDM1_AMBCJ